MAGIVYGGGEIACGGWKVFPKKFVLKLIFISFSENDLKVRWRCKKVERFS
jgi:hypothetical protein